MSAAILVSAALALAIGSAGATNSALGERDAVGPLREYIQEYLLSHGDDPAAERSAKVAVTRVRLSVRDPKGYVVHVTGGGWCGSGGCHTLIISKHAGRFEPLGFIAATELPIAVQPPSGGGDAAIVIAVRDMQHGGDATVVLTREGDSYDPRLGERHMQEAAQATIVIPKGAAAVPLYQKPASQSSANARRGSPKAEPR